MQFALFLFLIFDTPAATAVHTTHTGNQPTEENVVRIVETSQGWSQLQRDLTANALHSQCFHFVKCCDDNEIWQ